MKQEDDIIFTAELVEGRGVSCKYFSPRDMRRLMHAKFATRRALDGLHTGKFRTRQKGQSIEFHDYREYQAGDEINHIDWKVYGRTDKLVIKLFEHQTDLAVHLLVDRSRSMGFTGLDGARGDSKYDFSCRLAAAIGFLISKQNDRFSFSTAAQRLHSHVATGSTMQHLAEALTSMEKVLPQAKANLAEAVTTLFQHSKKRDLLCIFSDLLDVDLESDRNGKSMKLNHENTTNDLSLFKALQNWMNRGGDVIVFHVLHPHDIRLPETADGTFIDLENGSQVPVHLAAIRDQHAKQMQDYLSECASRFRKSGIDYNLVQVQSDYLSALDRYFRARQQRFSNRSHASAIGKAAPRQKTATGFDSQIANPT